MDEAGPEARFLRGEETERGRSWAAVVVVVTTGETAMVGEPMPVSRRREERASCASARRCGGGL